MYTGQWLCGSLSSEHGDRIGSVAGSSEYSEDVINRVAVGAVNDSNAENSRRSKW